MMRNRRRPLWALGSGLALLATSQLSAAPAGDAGEADPPTWCGKCHTLPPADVLGLEHWHWMVKYMKRLIEQQELGDPPSQEQVAGAIRWYEANCPTALEFLPPVTDPSPIAFEGEEFGDRAVPMPEGPPVIMDINVVDLDRDGVPDVVVSDIRNHVVSWVHRDSENGSWEETPLVTTPAPSSTDVSDVDGDGDLDVVVADLTQPRPVDDPIGKVLLLTAGADGTFASRTILTDVPRVTSVLAGNWDDDPDVEIMVATAGVYRDGGIGKLDPRGEGEYGYREIYARNGIDRLAGSDLDGDGRSDFVALISRQHEELVGFLGRGDGNFEERLLYKAPHPSWKLSDLDLIDLDRDGDVDVLFSNGRTLNIDVFPKPYHGVQWLENRGDLEFIYHDIFRMHGASAAAAADFDGDGDLDIAAVSLRDYWQELERNTLIWLENDGNQLFLAHAIARDPLALGDVETADFDADGRPDILVAGTNVLPPFSDVGRLKLWTNRGEARPER